MVNDFGQTVEIFFEKLVEGFEATNVTANAVSKYKAPASQLALNGQTFYRPMPLMLDSEDGRDMTGKYQGMTELFVPSTLVDSHLRNVPFDLTGVDINNDHALNNAVTATNIKLSNKIDTLVANKLAERATMAVISSGNIDSYDEAAEADALMLEQQCTRGVRTMLLNPRMAKNLAGNLAARQTFQGAPVSAYERNALPMIGGFDTYRVDYAKSIAGSAGSGYLVAGTNQHYTPVAKDANDIPVDNRQQTLTVDTGANAAVGDVFTIAGVYAVGHINKESTGQLKTFRILGISGGNWTISPAIVPADGTNESQKQYANVNTTPADNAVISILNTTTKPCSVFYERGAVELIHSDFNVAPFAATGKSVRKATTDSGIQIVMMGDSDIDTLYTKYRCFVWANVEVLNPELCGIMLEGQV